MQLSSERVMKCRLFPLLVAVMQEGTNNHRARLHGVMSLKLAALQRDAIGQRGTVAALVEVIHEAENSQNVPDEVTMAGFAAARADAEAELARMISMQHTTAKAMAALVAEGGQDRYLESAVAVPVLESLNLPKRVVVVLHVAEHEEEGKRHVEAEVSVGSG